MSTRTPLSTQYRLPIGRLSTLAGAAVTMLATIAGVFLYVPTERVQGPAQRIFYIHVPMAWIAYLAFFVVFVGSAWYLWKRDPRADAIARASAEIGVVFTTLVIVTGSLWGKPIWGTWWSWDARLTSTLVLWFIYVGYLMLRAYTAENPSSSKYAAVLGIVGFFDVPIIHQSVVWWRSLHPEPVVLNSRTGPQLPTEMLTVLLVALLAFTLLYVFLMLQKYTIERARDELRLIQAQLSADAVDDLSVTAVTPIPSPAGRATNQFPLPLSEG